jgi:hypothetical protein
MNSSRRRMATKTCHIKRVSMNAGTGITELPSMHLVNIPCTPLISLDESSVVNSIRPQPLSGAMVNRKQVMVFEPYDIEKGDTLVLDGIEYPITEANLWIVNEPFLVLIVNEVQANVEPDTMFVR